MNASGQERFMARVRRSMGLAQGKRPAPPEFFSGAPPEADLQRIRKRTREERLVLAERLARAGETVNLKVILKPDEAAVTESIVQLVREKEPEWGSEKSVAAWRHPLIDRLDLESALAGHDVPVCFLHPDSGTEARRRSQARIAACFVGVTSADYGVAETSTLVVRTRPDQARCISLLPMIHVAVLPLDRILMNLAELYTLLKWDPEEKAEGMGCCTSFISGPSKTADIEIVMVHGAHGPREMILYVITGEG